MALPRRFAPTAGVGSPDAALFERIAGRWPPRCLLVVAWLTTRPPHRLSGVRAPATRRQPSLRRDRKGPGEEPEGIRRDRKGPKRQAGGVGSRLAYDSGRAAATRRDFSRAARGTEEPSRRLSDRRTQCVQPHGGRRPPFGQATKPCSREPGSVNAQRKLEHKQDLEGPGDRRTGHALEKRNRPLGQPQRGGRRQGEPGRRRTRRSWPSRPAGVERRARREPLPRRRCRGTARRETRPRKTKPKARRVPRRPSSCPSPRARLRVGATWVVSMPVHVAATANACER